MNKILSITAIALVTVVMGLSAIAPMVQYVEAATEKVEICHKGETISVSEKAVPAHLKHGDSLGVCGGGEVGCPPDCDPL